MMAINQAGQELTSIINTGEQLIELFKSDIEKFDFQVIQFTNENIIAQAIKILFDIDFDNNISYLKLFEALISQKFKISALFSLEKESKEKSRDDSKDTFQIFLIKSINAIFKLIIQHENIENSIKCNMKELISTQDGIDIEMIDGIGFNEQYRLCFDIITHATDEFKNQYKANIEIINQNNYELLVFSYHRFIIAIGRYLNILQLVKFNFNSEAFHECLSDCDEFIAESLNDSEDKSINEIIRRFNIILSRSDLMSVISNNIEYYNFTYAIDIFIEYNKNNLMMFDPINNSKAFQKIISLNINIETIKTIIFNMIKRNLKCIQMNHKKILRDIGISLINVIKVTHEIAKTDENAFNIIIEFIKAVSEFNDEITLPEFLLTGFITESNIIEELVKYISQQDVSRDILFRIAQYMYICNNNFDVFSLLDDANDSMIFIAISYGLVANNYSIFEFSKAIEGFDTIEYICKESNNSHGRHQYLDLLFKMICKKPYEFNSEAVFKIIVTDDFVINDENNVLIYIKNVLKAYKNYLNDENEDKDMFRLPHSYMFCWLLVNNVNSFKPEVTDFINMLKEFEEHYLEEDADDSFKSMLEFFNVDYKLKTDSISSKYINTIKSSLEIEFEDDSKELLASQETMNRSFKNGFKELLIAFKSMLDENSIEEVPKILKPEQECYEKIIEKINKSIEILEKKQDESFNDLYTNIQSIKELIEILKAHSNEYYSLTKSDQFIHREEYKAEQRNFYNEIIEFYNYVKEFNSSMKNKLTLMTFIKNIEAIINEAKKFYLVANISQLDDLVATLL